LAKAKEKGKSECECKCEWGTLSLVAVILLIIGGLNWGVIGLFNLGLDFFNFDLVKLLFGSFPILVHLVYVLFGVAALYKIYVITAKKCSCKG
jgi:uncharacterized membrane protein YuzA (DUF378 family)